MDAVTSLRQQFQFAHQVLEGTMADVTPEQAHWQPPGIANPLGASYAHVLLGEDGLLNGMTRRITPLFAGEWGPKLGISAPPPAPGENWNAWARSVQVDLAALRAYAQAVFAATDAYLATLTDADLDQVLQFPEGFEFPPQPLGTFLGTILIGHVNNHAGEISVLKGVQGARGYPF
jgi:hypothetical protein